MWSMQMTENNVKCKQWTTMNFEHIYIFIFIIRTRTQNHTKPVIWCDRNHPLKCFWPEQYDKHKRVDTVFFMGRAEVLFYGWWWQTTGVDSGLGVWLKGFLFFNGGTLFLVWNDRLTKYSICLFYHSLGDICGRGWGDVVRRELNYKHKLMK